MNSKKDMDLVPTDAPQWWETFDGILEKLEELHKENLELKQEIVKLKKSKTRKKSSNTTNKQKKD